ncbi:hypothetical protein GORHZ_118_00120 [Gordonia rhizosphera NBRC 16068]|uniref:Uncharacterized protein n=1 Tax=Gordonia rhizosphera NBRC 16068 TaxID=1108045 RepID=K6WAP6_9ACTN|nr:hypothetical protein GORHZ_118_00120 [Gordonia rhizosphera NBRC 16068]
MTMSNLRCDMCDRLLPGLIPGTGDMPGSGVRFSYHPGDPGMRDDSGLLCSECWSAWTGGLGEPTPRVCAVCRTPVARTSSLFVSRIDDRQTWQFCAPHAAELLNRLRTVEPKFDPASFRLPLDRSEKRSL